MPAPTVVVLIPGLLGSELFLGEELIWPGTVVEYLRGYKRMAQLLDEKTTVGGIIRRFGPLSQYSTLIDDLGACGFREDVSPKTLWILPYDWRRDNAASAVLLANLLDAIVQDQQDNATIALIAHSMGGLVARYYLESGLYSTGDGFAAVRQLITLGTPHRGAPLALAAAVGQISRLFLNASQVRELANRSEYPSLYQLLPPPGDPFAWNEDPSADFATLDVYETDTAAKLGLSAANVESAKAFQKRLSLNRRPEHVRYFSFVGTQLKTITTIGLTPWKAAYRVRQLEAEHAGDKTVPMWSAALDSIQGYPVGGEHGTIFRDDMLRRLLAGLLGKKGVLAAVAPRIIVLVPERVVPPESLFEIHLTLPTPVTSVHGSIQFLRIPVDEDGLEGVRVVSGTPAEVRYDGSAVKQLQLILRAPSIAGFYEAAFVAEGQTVAEGSDRFIVQA